MGSADLPFSLTSLNKGLVGSVQKSMNPEQVTSVRWSLSSKKPQIHLQDKHIPGKFSRDNKARRKHTFFPEKEVDVCSRAGKSLPLPGEDTAALELPGQLCQTQFPH